MKTIFCDIDGTILAHAGTLSKIGENQEVLPGVVDKFDEWQRKSYRLIITTARPESMRELTEIQLENAGIAYHQLVMDLPTGPRYVINDSYNNGDIRAFGIPVIRDEGLTNVNI